MRCVIFLNFENVVFVVVKCRNEMFFRFFYVLVLRMYSSKMIFLDCVCNKVDLMWDNCLLFEMLMW